MKLEGFGLIFKNRKILTNKETKVSIKKGKEKIFFDIINKKEKFFYFYLSTKFNSEKNYDDSIFIEDTLKLAEKLGKNLDITKFKNLKI